MRQPVKKKTKIVATLGPASESQEQIADLIDKGTDVCRINFSHGDHDTHRKTINNIREVNRKLDLHAAILCDLQGPKLRVGEMEDDGVILTEGQNYTLTNQERKGTSKAAYINYTQLPKDVNVGEHILLDDGKLVLQVKSTDSKEKIETTVLHGGKLSSNKGVNLPNTKLSQPSMTDKDHEDLQLALELEVDWIALSFVRSARDIIELRHLIHKSEKNCRIIGKIEKPEAVEDIDEIIEEVDGLMIARGDLGVEIPLQNVPLVQKDIIRKCLRSAKPCIVATQMMDSMIEAITPTRAEVNDVANAVLDGTDAVMLSAETSIGKYPVQVIETMVKIVQEIEHAESIYHLETVPTPSRRDRHVTDNICFNAARLAGRVGASAIVTMTHSGYTAFKISSTRPRANVFVFTGNRNILNLLSLVWGVTAFYYDKMVSTDHTIADIIYLLKRDGFVEEDDYIINTASIPIQEKGMTNMLKLSKA